MLQRVNVLNHFTRCSDAPISQMQIRSLADYVLCRRKGSEENDVQFRIPSGLKVC